MMTIKEFNDRLSNDIDYKKYYVAYGSNMDLNQMVYRCSDAKFIGTGTIIGKLVFKLYADVELKVTNSTVPVVIFQISEKDEKCLDRYEGYPYLYEKKDVTVTLDGGGELTSMIYYMTDKYESYELPDISYYSNMEMCYKFFKFNLADLNEALAYSYKIKKTTFKYVAGVTYGTNKVKNFNNAGDALNWIKDFRKNHLDSFIEGFIKDNSSETSLLMYIDKDGVLQ